MDLAEHLTRGASSMGVVFTDTQLPKLLEYLDLLAKWNRTYNLTAVRDPAQMVYKHLLDSLSVVPFCRGQRVMDVGTGAGLPGVPLAIIGADRDVHLLDSNGKKSRFLFQVKTALGLDNITVHNARVETFASGESMRFDCIVSRAFASLFDMVTACQDILLPGGTFVAMKGAYPEQELKAVESLCNISQVQSVVIPGLPEQRHVVSMTLR